MFFMFALFAGMAVLAGLYIAFTRNIVRAGFALFVALAAQAALYVLAGAELVAVAQLVVYIGGILILLLFGVMLTGREVGRAPRTAIINTLPALLLCGGLLAGLLYAFQDVDLALAAPPPVATLGAQPEAAPPPALATPTARIGMMLLTDYVIGFEVVSVLLLLALVGAAYVARAAR